jgi:hypothetical protein
LATKSKFLGRVKRLFVALACALVMTAFPSDAGTKDSDEIRSEEYGVYNAVLDDIRMPREDAHALIIDQTLNLKCGTDPGNPILLNDCSGMVMPPDTPEDVHQTLAETWHQFDKASWNDWVKQNSKSAKLQDRFKTSWKHKLVGEDLPKDESKEWDSADCGFYFSRVGLNEAKTEAVVFVFFASYMDGVPSTGDYFFLRLDKAINWKLQGRMQYFKSDQQNR